MLSLLQQEEATVVTIVCHTTIKPTQSEGCHIALPDIVDVISNYVDLQSNGGFLQGQCPFHQDRRSLTLFMVYPTHQEYRCLGCPAHGNVIKFIIEIEKTKLDDAMKKMKPSGTAVRFLEDLITERLGSMGYKNIQHVHVELSQKWLVYQALVPSEMIERLSSAYFAVEQLAEVTDLSKQGVIEFLVLPDHRSTLTLDGNPVKF